MTAPTGAALAVLAARAAELARPLQDEQDGSTVELVLVALEGQQVAIPLRDVREVRPPGPVAQVPGSSVALAGVVAGHGEALAVASLASLLELPSALPSDEQWLVVLDHRTAPLGLLVDAVLDILAADPAELALPSDAHGLITAALPDGAVLLDASAVLRDPRLFLTPPESTKEPSWPEP